ncbi:MAG: hypothetical protein ACU0C9_14165, partial [Paracoccaceae bacterium]
PSEIKKIIGKRKIKKSLWIRDSVLEGIDAVKLNLVVEVEFAEAWKQVGKPDKAVSTVLIPSQAYQAAMDNFAWHDSGAAQVGCPHPWPKSSFARYSRHRNRVKPGRYVGLWRVLLPRQNGIGTTLTWSQSLATTSPVGISLFSSVATWGMSAKSRENWETVRCRQ